MPDEEKAMLNEIQESPRQSVDMVKKDVSNLDDYRCFQTNPPPSSVENTSAGNHLPVLMFDQEHLDFHNKQEALIHSELGNIEKFQMPKVYGESALAMKASEMMADGKLDKDGDGNISKEEIYSAYRSAFTDGSMQNKELTKQSMAYLLANYDKLQGESDDEWFGEDDGITLADLKENQTRIAEGEDWKSGWSKFGENAFDLATLEVWFLRHKTWA